MEIIKNREVKKFIMDPTNDLEEVIDFLEIDFKETIDGIFCALFSLLRHYEQNKSRVDYLVSVLEQLLGVKDVDELKLMVGPIRDLDNKVLDNFKLKLRMSIQEPLTKIHGILAEINNRLLLSVRNGKARCLEYLIFQDRNLVMIESFLESSSNVLASRNQDGDNIFAILLKRYAYLEEENVDEVEYLYHVIMLFIHSKHGKSIMQNKEYYTRLIRPSKVGYREHIIRLNEFFDPNFSISTEELEKRYKVKFDFPNIIMEEVNTFHMDNEGRADFTYQACITIDGKDTNCLDDALYIEKQEDGTYLLYIHITDIPSFIPYDSLTNENARSKIETLYLRDRNILLYPSYLSDCVCSLLPNNNRNVISYIFKLDSNFFLCSDDVLIVKGKIRSQKKLTYEEVDRRINSSLDEDGDLMLRQLFYFSECRRNQNKEKEEYRNYENFIRCETHHESLKLDCSPSANIVHESMILVNYSVAHYFKSLSLPYLYRKLLIPSNDFIERQMRKLQELDPQVLENKQILMQLRDSYMGACYSSEPVYHAGLKVDCYSHSTSPARRYADCYGQYLIYEFLFHNRVDDFNVNVWEYRTDELVRYLNEKKKENELFVSQYNYLSYKKMIKVKKK